MEFKVVMVAEVFLKGNDWLKAVISSTKEKLLLIFFGRKTSFLSFFLDFTLWLKQMV